MSKADSVQFYYAGSNRDIKTVANFLHVAYLDSSNNADWGRWYANNY